MIQLTDIDKGKLRLRLDIAKDIKSKMKRGKSQPSETQWLKEAHQFDLLDASSGLKRWP